jgi:hypothetical protein
LAAFVPLLLQLASSPAAVSAATTPVIDLDFMVTPSRGRLGADRAVRLVEPEVPYA